MANLEGMREKFIVIKHDDFDKVATPDDMNAHSKLVHKIKHHRESQGKKSFNQYLVINTDEPYVDEVIEIMKRHGHWG